jgi:hypothetical protein
MTVIWSGTSKKAEDAGADFGKKRDTRQDSFYVGPFSLAELA